MKNLTGYLLLITLILSSCSSAISTSTTERAIASYEDNILHLLKEEATKGLKKTALKNGFEIDEASVVVSTSMHPTILFMEFMGKLAEDGLDTYAVSAILKKDDDVYIYSQYSNLAYDGKTTDGRYRYIFKSTTNYEDFPLTNTKTREKIRFPVYSNTDFKEVVVSKEKLIKHSFFN